VRSFTCGKARAAVGAPSAPPSPRSRAQVIGNKWDTYMDLLQADYSEGCAGGGVAGRRATLTAPQ